ncbi:hypothetical protein RFZ45_03270, partial [Acinetobacter baumannii]|nr:hypothetical protein [Acinetobacter baumannii]
DNDNKSLSIVKIVRILNDSRGIAEVQFLDVIIDDSGTQILPKVSAPYYEGDQATCNHMEDKQ